MTKLFATATATALLLASGASAQMWADENEFRTGIADSGVYDAWDRDDEVGLNRDEFGTGIFTDWDRDNDMMISDEEYTAGYGRWYGAEPTNWNEWDVNADGMLDRNEFADGWDNDTLFSDWDADSDNLITDDEWGTGIYGAADANQDMVITIEEEGWFEGWFDGDDVEAEIQSVGDLRQ